MEDTGFEVRHEENLREHYAMTLRDWCANLDAHWDEAVEEVGAGHAPGSGGSTWPAASSGFERNKVQLHQVLGVKLDSEGQSHVRCARPSTGRKGPRFPSAARA